MIYIFKLALLFTASLLLTSACSNKGDTGNNNSPSIQGLDLSGTWRTAGIECYDSTLQNMTAVGILSSSSSVSTTTISGNQMTDETFGAGSCKVTSVRSIVANIQDGSASGGAGNGTFGATTPTIAPGSSCTTTISFTMSTGAVTPSSTTSNYTSGQSFNSQSFEFIINPPYLAITSLFQVVGRPTDICFLIIQKL